jgi:predicted  nucleic acid-binding Zn-ribbon protein
MGPTNVSLVKLFQADQQLRAARERLDAAAKNVRVQERRVNDLAAKLKASQTHHKELQAKGGNLDLDLRTRDAHIEKLRTQQQTAKNNKEYQAFLIEINTAKVDKTKVEEEAMRVMEQVDKAAAESAALNTQLEAERKRLTELSAQIDDTLKQLQAEVDALKPAREAAAAALPAKVLAEFDRLSDRFDGEALAALARPDRRREEYLCTSCNMDLVTDVYNKLHSRDELVFCPSCRRILYIPEDLPLQAAINVKGAKPEGATRTKSATRTTRVRKTAAAATPAATTDPADASEVVIEQRAKGKLGEVLAKAQGESVSRAAAADHKPFEFEVFVDGQLAGIYKGNSVENLERAIKYFMGEAGLVGDVRVALPVAPAAAEATATTADAAEPTAHLKPGDPLPQAPNLLQGADAPVTPAEHATNIAEGSTGVTTDRDDREPAGADASTGA